MDQDRKKPVWYKEKKYLLTYFLGGRNEKVQEKIDFICEKENLQQINLEIEFLRGYQIQNINSIAVSLEEFLYLVHHCDKMYTDSFHGSVFERENMKKENNMGTRIDSLLELFELQYCKNIFAEEDFSIDYEKTAKILNKRKRESIDYLQTKLTEVNGEY